MINRALGVLAASLIVTGCAGPAPTPSAVDTATAIPTASPAESPSPSPSPSASASRTASETTTPSARPTSAAPRTSSATTRSSAPTLTSSCKLAVSEESGDPLILFSYKVTDPAKRGWTITLQYTNDEGRNTERFSGTGNKSATVKLYGISQPGVKANCKATIKAR